MSVKRQCGGRINSCMYEHSFPSILYFNRKLIGQCPVGVTYSYLGLLRCYSAVEVEGCYVFNLL